MPLAKVGVSRPPITAVHSRPDPVHVPGTAAAQHPARFDDADERHRQWRDQCDQGCQKQRGGVRHEGRSKELLERDSINSSRLSGLASLVVFDGH